MSDEERIAKDKRTVADWLNKAMWSHGVDAVISDDLETFTDEDGVHTDEPDQPQP